MKVETVRAALMQDEGLRLKVYRDQFGIETIGCGRNLRDKGLSESEAFLLLDNDVSECVADLMTSFSWFQKLNEVRQHVLLNMRFQLGPSRFRSFTKMLAALEQDKYAMAAFEMANSRWASQTPNRAIRLIDEMKTGKVKP